MVSFNYYLLCSSHGCQEEQKSKFLLDEYNDDGNCLLTATEKKEFWFLCVKRYIINLINFDIAANKETIQLVKTGNLKKQNKDLQRDLRQLEQKKNESLRSSQKD